MLAAQYLGPKRIKITQVPKPRLKADEVLMETKAVGICGTDLHIYNGGMDLPIPLIPGHEFAGRVVKVGSRVKNVKVGDHIVAEHVIPCGHCEYCLQGKPNLCAQRQVIGLHRPGALAEYVSIPADLVYKIPKNLSFEEAALIEPLSIAVYSLKQAGQLLDKRVGVVGQGPIGILIDQLLKAGGAQVIGFDILKHRLDFVKKKKWVSEAVNSSRQRQVKKWSGKLDMCFEVVGREVTAQMCIDLARRDGDIFLIGVFENPAKLNLMQVVKKELNIYGSWTCAFTFPESIDLVRQGKIDLKSLITHRYKFSETPRAFAEANQYSEKRIKTVIVF